MNPIELHTVGQVARTLDLAQGSASRLLASGYAGPAYRMAGRTHDEALLASADQLRTLQAVPALGSHPEALVVRCAPRQVDETDDPRAFYGYEPAATWEENVAALGRWWPVRDPDYWVGKPLVASLVGFFVFAARIVDQPTISPVNGRVSFPLEHDTDLEETFLNHRIPATRGGITQHLAAGEANQR